MLKFFLIKLQAFRLQYRCFHVKFLRTPILKNICERLLLNTTSLMVIERRIGARIEPYSNHESWLAFLLDFENGFCLQVIFSSLRNFKKLLTCFYWLMENLSKLLSRTSNLINFHSPYVLLSMTTTELTLSDFGINKFLTTNSSLFKCNGTFLL